MSMLRIASLFFTYMQNAYEWNLVNNNLELRTKTADGGAVSLIFSQ
jgi:hypothetical protein